MADIVDLAAARARRRRFRPRHFGLAVQASPGLPWRRRHAKGDGVYRIHAVEVNGVLNVSPELMRLLREGQR